jgi:hypothetical protein
MDVEKLGRQAIDQIKSKWGLPLRGFVTGGSIANIIWELVSGNKAVVNDIDIFVFEKMIDKIDDDTKTLFKYKEQDLKYYEDYSGIQFSSYTKDFYTISESLRDGIFNTISYQSNTTDPALVISSFDINATKVGYSIDEDKIYWTKDFEEFLETGELRVSNLMTPSHTSVRIAKKSKELNVGLKEFEFNLLQYSLYYRFSDMIKLRFKDRYFDMCNEYKYILDKYFILCRDNQMESYVLSKFGEKTDLYYLKSIELKDSKKSDVFENRRPIIFSEDTNLSNVYLSGIFLFYMRNIYGNEEKVKLWSKLSYFFDDPNYFDKEVSNDDIDLLNRLCKFAPKSIENLKGIKLSEQVIIVKKLLDKFKDDPIIAISILEKIKVDKDMILDEQTTLLLELSVRKEIINDTRGKVQSILSKEVVKKVQSNAVDDWDI